MRTRAKIVVVAAAVVTVVFGMPSPASAAVLSYIYGPVAGPPGTAIDIEGQCEGVSSGTASLVFPVRSDALQGPIDSTSFTPNETGHFTAQLTNDIVTTGQFPPDDPIDLEVLVVCGDQSERQPFASTQRSTDAPGTIVTGLGAGPCGFNFGPADQDNSIPCPGHVKATTATGGINDTNFYALDWKGGATVAVGNINGDDELDIVAGSGPGTRAAFGAFNPAGVVFTSNSGFYGNFAGGVNVAVADLNGDGFDDIITGAGPGGGPHVKVFAGNAIGLPNEVGSFFAYDANFHGGVTVAAADVDGDGNAEIITGAGPGGGPHVKVFRGDGAALGGFFAYGPNFTGGVNVAGGNLVGDAKAEIVTGAGTGGGPHVRVLSADGSAVGGSFYAYDPNFAGGVAVAVGNANAAEGNEIVTGPQIGGGPHVRVFDPAGTASDGGFFAYSPVSAGIRVAVTP
ncbi:MAG: hypothetical protein QOF21_1498 [Actinomycetota bacterium]|jgi:hypothetical protein